MGLHSPCADPFVLNSATTLHLPPRAVDVTPDSRWLQDGGQMIGTSPSLWWPRVMEHHYCKWVPVRIMWVLRALRTVPHMPLVESSLLFLTLYPH